jgi:DNA-binding IclR family transcriptional regulator
MFGFAPLGSALIYAYHRDDRFLTAKEIAELAEISEDTARRHLERLVEIGRVEQRPCDRSRTYRLTDDLARKVSEALVTVPKSP